MTIDFHTRLSLISWNARGLIVSAGLNGRLRQARCEAGKKSKRERRRDIMRKQKGEERKSVRRKKKEEAGKGKKGKKRGKTN